MYIVVTLPCFIYYYWFVFSYFCQTCSSFRWNLRGAAPMRNDLQACLRDASWECRCWLGSMNVAATATLHMRFVRFVGVKDSHLMNHSWVSPLKRSLSTWCTTGAIDFNLGHGMHRALFPGHGVYRWNEGPEHPLNFRFLLWRNMPFFQTHWWTNSEAFFFFRRGKGFRILYIYIHICWQEKSSWQCTRSLWSIMVLYERLRPCLCCGEHERFLQSMYGFYNLPD